MNTKRKCRQYLSEYLAYGFIESPNDKRIPMCLVCNQTFTNEAMKPSRFRKHFESVHPDKINKPLEFFQNLFDQYKSKVKISGLFQQNNVKHPDGLLVSYKISELIAKTGKSHTVGETLIMPSIKIVLQDLLNQNPEDVLKIIPLSNSSVQRRIDEMAEDVESQLISYIQTRKFSLQLDETTLQDGTALLLAYVRFFDDMRVMQEEMLFAKKLTTDTTGISIFNVVKEYLDNNNVPIENIVSCATDGAPSMIGCYRGFLAHLKRLNQDILTVHCLVHRQHLVARNLSTSLNDTLCTVTQSVNKIKMSAKDSRIFKELCSNNKENHQKLLFYSPVRWLSAGNCLKRFVELFDSVVQFFENNDEEELASKLMKLKVNVSYLAGLFSKLNELNLKLQGKNTTLIDGKVFISSFIEKLTLFSENMKLKEFYHFPELSVLKNEISQYQIDCFSTHLIKVKNDMEQRFKDILEMNVHPWVINPFQCNVSEVELYIQEDLIELRNNEEGRLLFNVGGYKSLWQNNCIQCSYPNLWKKVELLLLAFPTSYLAECGFSAVSNLHSKQRNRLNIWERGDLRLFLTNLKPNIDLLAKKHQSQGSH